MSDRIHVCASDELDEGDREILTVRGREVGVLNVEGELYSLSNVCPHQQGPLCEGVIRNAIDGEFVGPGERVREFHTETKTISCPRHGWEFDLDTGEHMGDQRFKVPTYEVVVDDGDVYLEV